MRLSSTKAAERLTTMGVRTRSSTLRELARLGIFPATKNARDELEYTDDDIGRLAMLIPERRAASLAAFHAGRIRALNSKRAARNAQLETATA